MTNKIVFKILVKKLAKIVFNAFWTTSKNVRQNPKLFLDKKISIKFSKMVLKTILHGQMTEKIAFEVRPEKGTKNAKSAFLKRFLTTWPLGGSTIFFTTLNLRAKQII